MNLLNEKNIFGESLRMRLRQKPCRRFSTPPLPLMLLIYIFFWKLQFDKIASSRFLEQKIAVLVENVSTGSEDFLEIEIVIFERYSN